MEQWLHDPFAYLGPHDGQVRTYQPGAARVALVAADGAEYPLAPLSDAGLFAGDAPPEGYRLRIEWPDGRQLVDDPYRFGPVLGDLDLYL